MKDAANAQPFSSQYSSQIFVRIRVKQIRVRRIDVYRQSQSETRHNSIYIATSRMRDKAIEKNVTISKEIDRLSLSVPTFVQY